MPPKYTAATIDATASIATAATSAAEGFEAIGIDTDKPIRKYSKKELHLLLYQEPTKVLVHKINISYEGLIPRIRKAFLSKDVDAMNTSIRAFVERAVTFTPCPDCGGTRLNEAAIREHTPRAQNERRRHEAQKEGRSFRQRRADGPEVRFFRQVSFELSLWSFYFVSGP